jgi:BirA family biotin operon repressor/biotin-[acetyl-CoA-carboxylase] ligase
MLNMCKFLLSITIPKKKRTFDPLSNLPFMRKIILGEPLLHLESVDSTNTYATALLRQGTATEGTVILADFQTQGRGQGGNRWFSDAGNNLLCSIILKPDFLMAGRQFYLSMCVSNAILDLVLPITQPVRIKWPNDILVNERKVAGILIENTIIGKNLGTSLIGIGLNVNQKVFPPDLPNPTSLCMATGKEYDLADSLSLLLKLFTTHINMLYCERYAEIKTIYLNNLWGLNDWALYTDASGIFEGRIADVADSGELMVVLRSGVMKQYGFKEITFPHLV